MLRLLGTPHIVVRGELRAGLPEKAHALLALLILQFGGVASRDQFRTLLWEESTAERAAANLRWLLKTIRTWEAATGLALVDADRTSVRLAPGLASDVTVVTECTGVESRADLERLLDAYRGELLAGLDGSFGQQLLDVIARHRTALRLRFVALARAAAERIGGERAEDVLRRLIAEAPEDEALVRALLLHLSRERGPRAVAAEYEKVLARFHADYGVAPAVETAAVAAQLAPSVAAASAPPGDAAAAAGNVGIPRIVLLPPAVPFSVDPHSALVAAAMVEDVSLQLCRMRTFAMFAPHTARQVTGLDPVAAVAPYGVGYVAATRLLPAVGGGLRLSLSLIRTATSTIVFAGQFDFDEARLGIGFAELAESIAGQLSAAVEKVEIGAYRRTGSASAYVQYLLGSRALVDNELKSLRRARSSFARALDLEPNYVPALTGIAHTLSKESLALRRADDELPRRAMDLAERASRIDPLDPNAWREKALASLYLNDIDAGLEYLDMALTRAPHHADIIAEKADVLVHASRLKEGRELILEAIALNPLPPDDYIWTLGSAEYLLGRYEPALATLGRMKNTRGAGRLIAAAAAMAGDLPTAAKYRRRWMRNYPSSRISSVAQVIPHASRVDLEHFVEGLRRAGFPD